jgi:hypothetical protein
LLIAVICSVEEANGWLEHIGLAVCRANPGLEQVGPARRAVIQPVDFHRLRRGWAVRHHGE